MYSGREGVLGVEKAPSKMNRSKALDKVVQWLVERGVERKRARQFIIKSGCDSQHSMAVYLRFQLPPLHLSNVECVDFEMNHLLGVVGKKAQKIINDLDVVNAVNVDINQEAATHLFNTGVLPAMPSSTGFDHSPTPSGRHLNGNSMNGLPTSGYNILNNLSRPGSMDRAGVQHMPSPRRGASPMNRQGSTEMGVHGRPIGRRSPSPGPLRGEYFPLRQASLNSQVSIPTASVPPPKAGGVGEAANNPIAAFKTHNGALSRSTAGDEYFDMAGAKKASLRPSSADLSVPHIVNNPIAGFEQSAVVNPIYAHSDNTATGSGSSLMPFSSSGVQMHAQQAAQKAVVDARARASSKAYGNRQQMGSAHSQADSRLAGAAAAAAAPAFRHLAPQSPVHSPMPSDTSPGKPTRGGRAIGEGHEGYVGSEVLPAAIAEGQEANDAPQKWAPLPDEYLASMNSDMADGHGPVMKTMPGLTGKLGQSGLLGTAGMSEPIASEKLPGVPTCSRAIDPGAYNQANSMLRSQIPHYHAKVTVKTHWDHICVWLIQIISLITYITIRAAYLVSGKSLELAQTGVNIPYSWLVLIAEIGLGTSGVYLRQNFWKQTTEFRQVPPKELSKITKAVSSSGMKQTVHVLIATYTEPAVTVKECVLRCLVAPEPIYMEKMIYVCDDGHSKSEGPKKRAMVEELRILGHTNVFYVGDRIKKPGQLNGKSANLNHVLLHKIYPTVRKAEEVPIKDIFMVMDCDHMVKPDIFNKMGPCMLDERVAVCLVPQCFHNLIYPDALDAANGDFMFGRLPFFFGAGVLFVTGTNVMIRSRSAFEVCKFAEANAEATADGEDHRQLFTVDEISEDVVLGSRLHAAGFKGVFVAENLATGEVPLEARAMWRQRFRWFKGGHLFLLSPTSVFFDKSRHMSFYQKSLYWICLVANVLSIIADPILLALPPLCLIGNICVYGLDQLLFWTHITHTLVTQIAAMYYLDWSRVVDALKAHVAARVLWFTTVKACINTVMVLSGWKKSGVFKATPKLGENPADLAPSTRLPDVDTSKSGSGSDSDAQPTPNSKEPKAEKHSRFSLHHIHDSLSKVTEVRKHCLPFDGTLDFWVIMGITLTALFSVAVGVHDLWKKNALTDFQTNNESLKWLAISWALHEAMPGMVFAGYLATWDLWPRFMKFWLPFVTFGVALCILFVERGDAAAASASYSTMDQI